MKKFLLIILLLVAALMLCSCSGEETADTAQMPTPEPTAVPTLVSEDIESADGLYRYDLYSNDMAVLTRYYGEDVELVVPSKLDGHSVMGIGEESFLNSSNWSVMTKIVIPEGVTTIGEAAFHRCSSLVTVVLPSTLRTIEGEAFSYCSALQEIVIPEGVTTIGNAAFRRCTALKKINIPKSVTAFGPNPFDKCDVLTDFGIAADHPFLTMVDGVMFDKVNKSLVCYPTSLTAQSYVVPAGTLIIGGSAFSSNPYLTSVTIPGSVKRIEDRAFYYVSAMPSIVIPEGVEYVGEWAFRLCSVLTDVTLPASVNAIGDGAFSECSKLKSIHVMQDSYAHQFCTANYSRIVVAN